MRYLALLTLFLLPIREIRAEAETFFDAEDNLVGSYIAPVLRFNSANEQFGVWAGARIGNILNSILAYGFEGYGLISKVEGDKPFGERMQAGVAGCYMEAIMHPNKKVHVAFAMFMGAGTAVAEEIDDISQDDMWDNSFLVMEPEVSAEYNLSRNVRFAPGFSYRWISGTVTPLDSKWDLSETSINFRLKFGDFEGKRKDSW